MTQLTEKRRRNGNGSPFPSLRNDFLTSSFFTPSNFFTPSLLDFDDEFFTKGVSCPLANITESTKEFKLDLCAPGMKRDDFKINIEDGVLTISSETEEEKKDEDKNYRRREFSYSSFSRTFALPDNTDENNINAKYDNGMLQVTIPKKEMTVAKPKKEIKVG
ncbi:MAG TPA: Hsp20/alpha crystallin family protein [Bacteroidia bacterium]|jgi:HSP20 family protein|nr:Hsp20/alpha crystallin family protein [Bacteroidia bacterium]